MRTVGEVAALTKLTVRALHHYDEIGLVRPTARTDAGYRLYGDADLQRLQTVLFYRELGLGLDAIKALVGDPDFDRGAALRQQRRLLADDLDRTRRLLRAIDDAIDAHERGTRMSDEELFEVFGDEQRELQHEAEQRWGGTDAWSESKRRTSSYSKQDWQELKEESEAITLRIAEVYRSGGPSDGVAAMDAVDAHRRQIDARFYACSPQMHRHLGDMYIQDARFTATYEGIAVGLAAWVRDAIHANADRLETSAGS